MQVSCGQCGAKYEFDASMIPAQGYDAQCTQCSAVFFVAPEAPAAGVTSAAAAPNPLSTQSQQLPEPKSPSAQVSIACDHCGARYEFSAADIPAEGYDAQCTSCQGVFFVSADPLAKRPGTPHPQSEAAGFDLLQPTAAAPSSVPSGIESSAYENIEPQTPGPSPLHGGVAAIPAQADGAAGYDAGLYGASNYSDVMALDAELGEPMAAPGGATPEEDFERLLRKRKRRLRIGFGAAAVILAYTAGTYVFLPRLFDLTLGRLVGIKRTVDPDAIPFVEQGLATMMEDNAEAYGRAIGSFEQALQIDPLYPEALALLSLARTFVGADLQAQGRHLFDQGNAALEELAVLEASKRRDDAKIEALRVKAKQMQDASMVKFEEGGRALAVALSDVEKSYQRFSDVGIVLDALGIHHTLDPDRLAKAEKILRKSLDARGLVGKPLDIKTIPSVWTGYLQARILAGSPREHSGSLPWFEAVRKLEPNFVRATYDQARVHYDLKQFDAARRLLESLLARHANHEKSKTLLENLPVPKPPEVMASPGAREKETPRGRRRRR